jgi:type VI secretion system protein ImpK
MASSDDPFDLNSSRDSDRTIMIPAPGGRRPVPAPEIDAPKSRPSAAVRLPMRRLGGINPLVAVANPLLNLVAPLRSTLSHPDPAALAEQLMQAVRQFEDDARADRIDSEVIRDARYILCTFIDEAISATPWGGGGVWSKRSLLVAFHRDVKGGEQFFQMLRQFGQEAHRHVDLLELMYICLTLGFAGRYARVEGGRAQLDELRERLFRLLQEERGRPEKELSPHWVGVVDQRNPLIRLVPLWVVGAVGALLLFATYIGFSYHLSDLSDPVRAKIAAIKLEDAPLPVVLPDTTRLRPFLESEIKQHLVDLKEDRDKSVVTLRGRNLFQPGTASLETSYESVMARIADALKTQPGKVVVVGHTDNMPIRTPRFHSNYELSVARAQSVMESLIQRAGNPSRFSADGRGQDEPLVSNNSAENRARNRRVDITLFAGSGK